jgi:hypothetical protein
VINYRKTTTYNIDSSCNLIQELGTKVPGRRGLEKLESLNQVAQGKF